jgi:hypothetical protein
MEKLCHEEVDALGVPFRGAARLRGPKAKTLAGPLQQAAEGVGLWAVFLKGDVAGPGWFG